MAKKQPQSAVVIAYDVFRPHNIKQVDEHTRNSTEPGNVMVMPSERNRMTSTPPTLEGF